MADCPIFISAHEARNRTSSKWRAFPDDVIPMHVAEADVALAPGIAAALHDAVTRSDTGGYHDDSNPARAAFARFTRRHWDWELAHEDILVTTDVSVGIVEILRRILPSGGRVIVTPPVYPPFYELIAEAGAEVVSVPLVQHGGALRLDLNGIAAACEDGAKAFLLCHPHNPTGTVHSADELRAVSSIIQSVDGWVISDEIHAPLVRPGSTFVPYTTVSDAAREHGFTVHSASKGYNIPGLKCALVTTESVRTRAIRASMPIEVTWRTSQFGAIATAAAYDDCDDWLSTLRTAVAENATLLSELVDEFLPDASYDPPAAGYLAWIDLHSSAWGDAPAERILERGRVAVGSGLPFGAGSGCIRLNIACAPETLRAGVERIAHAVAVSGVHA